MYYFFDFRGAYLGYLDDNGHFIDESGEAWARLLSGGRVVAPDGSERGHLDAQGCFFDREGICLGYLRNGAAEPPTAEVR